MLTPHDKHSVLETFVCVCVCARTGAGQTTMTKRINLKLDRGCCWLAEVNLGGNNKSVDPVCDVALD